MTDFAAEFRDVFSRYEALGRELAKIVNSDNSPDAHSLVQSILQNQDCLTRIIRMSADVTRLSDAWLLRRSSLETGTRAEAESYAEAARAQAVKLQEMCRLHAQKLQTIREGLRSGLEEISKGARYAKGLKPPQNNFPKFIDSRI
jgi:hypothetical protein